MNLRLLRTPLPPASRFPSLAGSNCLEVHGTVIQTLIPFPQYSDIYNTYETDGTAFYNGLQAQGEKRFSDGLSYLADLTLSRNIANESVGSTLFQPNPINSFDMPPEFTPSATDQKYIANFVATYALPFGYGQEVSEF